MIEQLQDKLKEHGLTEDWVLDRLKEEGEDKKSRANVRLDVIKFVAELNNMVSSKKYSDEITERVYLSEGVVKELEAKRKLTSYEGGKEERISSINGE